MSTASSSPSSGCPSMTVSRLVVAGLALLVAGGAFAADTPPADEVTVATVAALGLQESGTPVAERADWRKPRRVIVRTGPEPCRGSKRLRRASSSSRRRRKSRRSSRPRAPTG